MIEHIKGEDNVVADAFSRLVPLEREQLNVIWGEKIPKNDYDLIGKCHNTAHPALPYKIRRFLQ